MSSICYFNKNFFFIDSSAKNGVFCRFFSPNGKSRSLLLQNTHTMDYSAHLAPDGKPEMVILSDAAHIYYYTYAGTQFTKTLLTTAENNAVLKHPFLYMQNHTSQMVYLSKQPSRYQLLHQVIGQESTKVLVTFEQCPTLIKYYQTPTALYCFYSLKEDDYSLNCLKIESDHLTTLRYLQTDKAIADYSVCVREEEVHVCYVLEAIGRYQLYYINPLNHQVISLTSSSMPMSPAIFFYYHGLWVNTLIDNKLHTLLSVNDGENFSIPVPCSIQNHLQRSSFISSPLNHLNAQEVYISLDTKLRVCVISSIDVVGLHEHSSFPVELELLLEGLSLSHHGQPNEALLAENARLKQEIDLLKRQAALASNKSLPKSKSNITSAASSFMEELTSWDLPPRL